MLPSIASARSMLLQVCRPSLAAAKSLVHPLTVQSRTFASEVPHTPVVIDPSKPPSKDTGGPLRPHLGIEVNPNHGLYGFFHKKVGEDGQITYETVEPVDWMHTSSGRSWTAAELRRKSFKDIHTLWYILLREQNVLATQRHELKRLGADVRRTEIGKKAFRVRKGMARIKYVINERRLAYLGALEIQAAQRKAVAPPVEDSVQAEEISEDPIPEQSKHQPNVADVAAAGLFGTAPTRTSSSSAQAEPETKSQ